MATNWYINQTIDLQDPERGRNATISPLAVVGDNDAHVWAVTVLDNGAAKTLTGCTVVGNFILPNGATVVEAGSASGSVASVTLPSDCYTYPGSVRCIMRVYDGETVMAAAAIWVTVEAGATNQIVDAGGIVPDINNILAEYAAMKAAVDDTDAATETALAAAASINRYAEAIMQHAFEPETTLALTQGGINTTTGKNTGGTAAPRYCRTTSFIEFDRPILFKFSSNVYRFEIWTYSAADNEYPHESITNNAYIAGSQAIIPYDGVGKWFRLAFRAVADNTELDSSTDYPAILAAISFAQLTDTTLAESGVAADAKATGDAISALETDLTAEIASVEAGAEANYEYLRDSIGEATRNLWLEGDVTTNSTGYKTLILKNPLPPGTYTLSAIVEKSGSTTSCNWALSSSQTTSFGPADYVANGTLDYGGRDSDTFTTTETAYSVRLFSANSSSAYTGLVATWRDIQIEAGSSATLYIKPFTIRDDLSATGDSTDRTNDILTQLAAVGECRLGPGTFIVHALQMPPNTRLTGSGPATTLRLNSTYHTDNAIILDYGCQVDHMRIIGSGGYTWTADGTITASNGLYMTGSSTTNQDSPMYDVDRKRVVLEALEIAGFKGGALCLNDISGATADSVSMTNSYIHNCNVGIYIPFKAEFNKITNVRANKCYYGCINNGGNNVFENCGFDNNEQQLLMDNTGGAATNNSHGSFVGCTFNHSQRNNNCGTAIELINIGNGEMFVGCQFFYGVTILTGCEGVVFSACNYGNGSGIYVSGGGGNVMSACMFKGINTSEPQQADRKNKNTWFVVTNNDKFVLADCYTRAGAQVTLS